MIENYVSVFFFLISLLVLTGECSSYKTLSEASRVKTYKNNAVVECDRNFGGEWYRFSGAAGDRMPESVVSERSCGTHAPGWLDDKHPSMAEGVVSRKVCFHWSGNSCRWSIMIQVRNCGNFYVYKLGKAPACSLRYCGENSGESMLNRGDGIRKEAIELFKVQYQGIAHVESDALSDCL